MGKSIGKLFGLKTDYVTRYVNYDPRNKDDTPDAFESAALDRFREDGSVKEIYDFTEYDDTVEFRYVAPMFIDKSCLDCHGEPAGEIDIVGFPKEGWQIGDLAGALSIIMPTDIYMENKKSSIRQEVAFFTGVMLLIMLVTYYATAKLVTNPLNKLKMFTEQVRTGNLDLNISDIDARGEIKDLAVKFDDMIKELRTVYGDLENNVAIRTNDLARANEILEVQQAQLELANMRAGGH